MAASNAGSQEGDARPDERDARGLGATGAPLELPTWQQIVLAIPEEDKTPTVRLLLGVIDELSRRLAEQLQRIQTLEAELARLKGDEQKPRSNSKPSTLSQPPKAPPADGKRPGSAKRSKTSELTIHQEVPVTPKNLPPGSTFLRHSPFVVQDLAITAKNTRYLLETWRTPEGKEVHAELPAGIRGHFGPGLIGFVLQQHYATHVPQPRILDELHDFGIDISSGQVNNIVTEKHDTFHAEKDALLPAGLQSTYVNVDDSGAPHQGQYGSCLCISNDFFTTYHSSETKERSKFLDVLRCGHTDYVLNEVAWSYLVKQGLPQKVLVSLQNHAQQTFADANAWNQHLDALEITSVKHRQTVTEAALLGSVVAHGVSPELGIVSDGAAQYAMFVHGLCWVHQERNLAKLVPCGPEQCQAHEQVLASIWQLYGELKAYRLAPSPSQVEKLSASFDTIVSRTTCFPELNAALTRMGGNKADLLRVLERPDLPLHSNTVERDFRDWATKRKISAGTRSDLGKRCRDTFLSLKSSCKKLGIRFWAYLQDRLLGTGQVPDLSELVRQKATGTATI
jgi:hypothetical protein